MRPVSPQFVRNAAAAAKTHGAGFNVVAIGKAALEQHFGPSLRPAIALFEHYYDEVDAAMKTDDSQTASTTTASTVDKKRPHSGGDAADSGAAAKRAKK